MSIEKTKRPDERARVQNAWDLVMSLIASQQDGEVVDPATFAAAVSELLTAVRQNQTVPRL